MNQNIKLELPEEFILVNRNELRRLIQEVFIEIYESDTTEEIMTIQETAEYLKVSIPTVRSLIAESEIPFFRRGQVIRLNRSDVREWLRNNSKEKTL